MENTPFFKMLWFDKRVEIAFVQDMAPPSTLGALSLKQLCNSHVNEFYKYC